VPEEKKDVTLYQFTGFTICKSNKCIILQATAAIQVKQDYNM